MWLTRLGQYVQTLHLLRAQFPSLQQSKIVPYSKHSTGIIYLRLNRNKCLESGHSSGCTIMQQSREAFRLFFHVA